MVLQWSTFSRFGHYLHVVLNDPQFFWWLAALVVCGDALLTLTIIKFVPYTEIDWETYMFHIDLYNSGERDYQKITGPTGHLVYPAGHVHIHRVLSHFTDGGNDIQLAQIIYGLLYVSSLALSCAIYWQAGTPNWSLVLLSLSKRLHSLYVLRLFNDTWATAFMQASILAFSVTRDTMGVVLFSLALSVKMSILLYFPAVILILVKRRGIFQTFYHICLAVLIQVALAYEFLYTFPWSYIAGAFDFSRTFLYKWTVNWKILDEGTFLSPRFARVLTIAHLTTLLLFGLFKWCKRDEGAMLLIRKALTQPTQPASSYRLKREDVIAWLLTSNLIGMTFARSLHYQFYSWYSYQLPLLALRSKYPVVLCILTLTAIEYSWNKFPATAISSSILLAGNAALVIGQLM